MNLYFLFNRIKQKTWLAEVLAALAGLAYFYQSWIYSHTRDSVLDEGLYLLKGYLFLTGKYQPFQPYGVQTNHMPLSFLIPGFFQYVFGPGLRTGRYYAVFISLLFFLGTWIVVRRLGGRWWAGLVACTLAMNPLMIKVYSQAVSEGLVACLLVWVLVFTLGDDRRPWQILTGSFLSGILLMTRLNMSPVLPFLMIYITWQYGFRLGFLTLVAGLIPVLWGHIQYFPEIMTLWAKWFPEEIAPFLSQWRFEGMNQLSDITITPGVRLKGFYQGFSLHVLPWLGILVSWCLWPKEWRKSEQRAAIFLSTLYAFLFILHAWATLAGTHCIFCFSWYQYFFEILVILLIVITWKHWTLSLSPMRKIIAWGIVLLPIITVVLGILFGVNKAIPTGLDNWVTTLQNLNVPRWSEGQFQQGQIKLWAMIANKFGSLSKYSYDQAYQLVENWLRALIVLILAVVFLIVIWWIAGRLKKREVVKSVIGVRADRTALTLGLILVVVWLATPLGFLGKNSDSYDCGVDIITTYETAGKQLADQIPPGSKIFWLGGDTQAALLYLRDVDFFPALFNSDFGKRQGDPEVLERYGLWNEALVQKWTQEADIILVETRSFNKSLDDYLTSGEFNELTPTSEMGCRVGTSIHIYERLP